ncbi:MAG: GerMN domain-containing protein [Candidatus Desulforudis sp.]|nr:GerMN domain-containing protein [Desulforudis sp.]
MTKTLKSNKRVAKLILVVLTGILALALLVSGCGRSPDPEPVDPAPSNGADGEPPISSEPSESKVTLILYFSDDQAMYLEQEQRETVKGSETLEELVINELMKGPEGRGTGSPIPEGTRLLGVSVVEGVAYVNFSKEFQTKHWGGSTGESHTVYAIVHSLCELEGIEKVQFMLEGDPLETLGHMDLTQPVAPDPGMVR